MLVEELIELLDEPNQLARWLADCRIENIERAVANLDSIARSGMTIDQVAGLCTQLRSELRVTSHPDMALNNLEKFVTAARNRIALGSLFERDPTALPILLKIFSASQYLSDLLCRDTESYDYLRLTEGASYPREVLVDELLDAVSHTGEAEFAMQILRRFRHRETLRIAFADLIAGYPVEQVASQLSLIAEAGIEAAVAFAARLLLQQLGHPQTGDGDPCRFTILALGKLGGGELNYSSDIDLIAVYEADGSTSTGKPNQRYFERLTREVVRLLSETTALGAAWRVDLRLRPEGSKGPICCSRRAFLRYYDLQGRTWERQAFIKARAVAGDIEFGNELLKTLQPWIYRPILNSFDIAGVKSLKRQIERRAFAAGEQQTNIKTGHGGIRDIEFVIQFLQLLNGGKLESVRTTGTLDAVQKLREAECLKHQEAELLAQNYRWLRQLEHRLQIMFDLQTHSLPEDESELRRMAMRMGYRDYSDVSVRQQFDADLKEITSVNNQILNHLLHGAFPDEVDKLKDGDRGPSAVDLVLQPDISPQEIDQVLGEYGFHDTLNAGQLWKSLASENSVFLSSRRCRHFLAAIANELLQEISTTPNPDSTLVSLSLVADAVGGKSALWELFSFNRATMELFVRLCAAAEYLSTIIRRNPGMIDELIDSLLMTGLPSIEWLRLNLSELAVGAEDTGLIVRSFKNVHHLRVGIRDVAGRDPINETHRALSDIAEVCIEWLASHEFQQFASRYAKPEFKSKFGPRQFPGRGQSVDVESMAAGRALGVVNERFTVLTGSESDPLNDLVILAVGKLGGKEPNYHSDLDVIFLYKPENESGPDWLTTSRQNFYCRLATGITKAVTSSESSERLYQLDSRLRPTGKSGSLAVSFNEFERYFDGGSGQLWELMALCKSRPIFGRLDLRSEAMELVKSAIRAREWKPEMADEIRDMRIRMQENSRASNLKRSVGGTVDVEFVVQMLQIKLARIHPECLLPGTIESIDAIVEAGEIESEIGYQLIEGYQYLRAVEARLRLINATARHDFPKGEELEKIAYLLRIEAEELAATVQVFRHQNRRLFELIFDRESRR